MQVPPVIKISKAAFAHAAQQFDSTYGRTVGEWSRLERGLCDWFTKITGMHDDMARAIFYSARGFGSRAEMMEAAIDEAKRLTADELTFIKAALVRARKYSEFRNAMIHGVPTPVATNNPNDFSVVISKGRDLGGSAEVDLSKQITTEQLAIAASNFLKLFQCVAHTLSAPHLRHHLTPKQALSLVQALPNQANEKSTQTVEACEIPPEHPVRKHRNKKAYREQQQQANKRRPVDPKS